MLAVGTNPWTQHFELRNHANLGKHLSRPWHVAKHFHSKPFVVIGANIFVIGVKCTLHCLIDHRYNFLLECLTVASHTISIGLLRRLSHPWQSNEPMEALHHGCFPNIMTIDKTASCVTITTITINKDIPLGDLSFSIRSVRKSSNDGSLVWRHMTAVWQKMYQCSNVVFIFPLNVC